MACVIAKSPQTRSLSVQKESCGIPGYEEVTDRSILLQYNDISEVRCLATCNDITGFETTVIVWRSEETTCNCLGSRDTNVQTNLITGANACFQYTPLYIESPMDTRESRPSNEHLLKPPPPPPPPPPPTTTTMTTI
ncbi:hypothetical protein PoB_000498100 [Plakobranchus ocellatus]|uniref:WSC domain-containing protein n=1 Tax=Plakobranchus ocellatus TaxID=259542 RepID=A0AAV3Y7U2_9GAST|nr:hypothetical protein PoB_000498100 [Plakobranchus ocellatus]